MTTPASLEEHVPFDVGLADGRRTPVEPDRDTALWVPPAMRSATVGELRARCAEATAPLAGWPDDKEVTYQWALIRHGDPVAVVGRRAGCALSPTRAGCAMRRSSNRILARRCGATRSPRGRTVSASWPAS